jgi:pyruvate carboxylase
MLFGDIVKVTPSSKVVGDLALFLVSHGMSVREFENLGPNHRLNIPNSVHEMLMGSLGEPQGGWPAKVRQVVLKGQKPRRGRPGALLEPVDLQATADAIEKKIARKPTHTEVLSYIMYPEVFLKYARNRHSWGDVSVIPTTAFFYGMRRGEEITIEIEPGKALVIKFLTIGEPHPDGTRTVFFELNGQPREVTIRDRKLEVHVTSRPKADPAIPGHVGAPIPGAITALAVELNQPVEKGAKLIVLEAMKMQTTITAPISGKIVQRLVQAGDQVEPKDLLLVIE